MVVVAVAVDSADVVDGSEAGGKTEFGVDIGDTELLPCNTRGKSKFNLTSFLLEIEKTITILLLLNIILYTVIKALFLVKVTISS